MAYSEASLPKHFIKILTIGENTIVLRGYAGLSMLSIGTIWLEPG